MASRRIVSKIASLRRKQGLTQAQLADLLEVTVTTVYNWERSKNGVEQFRIVDHLCKILECQAKDLYENAPDIEIETKSARHQNKLEEFRKRLNTSNPAITDMTAPSENEIQEELE
jgi:transcriptional regulator with XRE-family HTH domain